MSKVKTIGLLVVLAFVAMMLPAFANLVPTTFGFPVIVQNGSTSAFNQDTATAVDFENVSINIPVFDNGLQLGSTVFKDGEIGNGIEAEGLSTSNVLPFGPVNLAFPSISQTVIQNQSVTHTDFAQTNEFAEFAYPFIGVGPVALPGFGFGW